MTDIKIKFQLVDNEFECFKNEVIQMGLVKNMIEDIEDEIIIPLELNKKTFSDIIEFNKKHLTLDFTEVNYEDIEYQFSNDDLEFIKKFDFDETITLMNACDFLNHKLLLKLAIKHFTTLMSDENKKWLENYMCEKYKDDDEIDNDKEKDSDSDNE
jgi:hypothetical protein